MQRVIRYVAVAVVAMLPTETYAQQQTCKLQSIEKKLTGPALTTFMQKCENDVETTCEKLTTARNLEEPNRSLFIKTCIKAFVG